MYSIYIYIIFITDKLHRMKGVGLTACARMSPGVKHHLYRVGPRRASMLLRRLSAIQKCMISVMLIIKIYSSLTSISDQSRAA